MNINGTTVPHMPEDYDVQIKRTIPYYEIIHKEIIDLVRTIKHRPTLWLDTGCGTGSLVRKAMDIMPDTRFVLTDPSEKMLDQAKKKFNHIERVSFLENRCTQDLTGTMEKGPDVITAVQCHHYLSRADRERAIGVCFNLLRDDGLYVTFENIRPFTSQGIEIGKRNWGRFLSEVGKGQEEIDVYLARFDKDYFPITVEEHLQLLRKAGFSTVELFWYSYMQAGFYCIK
jgi:tRNA (cmo5U34)-methyltransferase